MHIFQNIQLYDAMGCSYWDSESYEMKYYIFLTSRKNTYMLSEPFEYITFEKISELHP